MTAVGTAESARLSAYLSDVRERGLLHTVDGLPCVLGVSSDELSSEQHLLVEYVDPALLTTGGAADALWDRMRELRRRAEPDAEVSAVMLRTPADGSLPPPWRRHLTYVRLVADPPPPVPGAVEVVEAREGDRPLVVGWLVYALLRAAREQGRPVDGLAAVNAAEAIMDAPGRRTLLVRAGDEPVGHATLLVGAQDPLTGEEFTDLVDILVEPVADGSLYRKALVAAAAELSRACRLPLIGHVVHGTDGAGDAVLDHLCARGWAVDHRYWSAPADRLPEQASRPRKDTDS